MAGSQLLTGERVTVLAQVTERLLPLYVVLALGQQDERRVEQPLVAGVAKLEAAGALVIRWAPLLVPRVERVRRGDDHPLHIGVVIRVGQQRIIDGADKLDVRCVVMHEAGEEDLVPGVSRDDPDVADLFPRQRGDDPGQQQFHRRRRHRAGQRRDDVSGLSGVIEREAQPAGRTGQPGEALVLRQPLTVVDVADLGDVKREGEDQICGAGVSWGVLPRGCLAPEGGVRLDEPGGLFPSPPAAVEVLPQLLVDRLALVQGHLDRHTFVLVPIH